MSSRNRPSAAAYVALEDDDYDEEAAVTKRPESSSCHGFPRLTWQSGTTGVCLYLLSTTLFLGWDVLLLFNLLVFIAIVLLVVCGIWCPRSSSKVDYSDFGVAIQTVEDQVREDASSPREGAHLPLQQPPATASYYLEDRTFGIVHKKSGDVFLEGSSTLSVMRLHFSPSTTTDSYGFASFNGSRVLPEQQQQSTPNGSSSSVISKGLVAMATKKAYFVEETSFSSGTRIQRVVSGKFADEYIRFAGEWLASDGSRGYVCIDSDPLRVDYAVPLVMDRDNDEEQQQPLLQLGGSPDDASEKEQSGPLTPSSVKSENRLREEKTTTTTGSTTTTTTPVNNGKRVKSKDKPRRPLSAYNLFFKDQRACLLEAGGQEARGHGKLGFENLSKIIGERWRELPSEQMLYYKEKAEEDMKRYRSQMEEYLARLEKSKEPPNGPFYAAAAQAPLAQASAVSASHSENPAQSSRQKPRRPLSAYNIFFKAERARILKASGNDTLGFENLATIIGKRWSDITPEELEPYKQAAAEDMKRYKDEMKEHFTAVDAEQGLSSNRSSQTIDRSYVSSE